MGNQPSHRDTSEESDDSYPESEISTPPPVIRRRHSISELRTTPLLESVEPASEPASEPTRPIVDTRDDKIRNLIATADGVPQIDQLIRRHGEPTRIIGYGHAESPYETKRVFRDISKVAYDKYDSYVRGILLKDMLHDIYVWDNRVAFTVKHPNCDDTVTIGFFSRKIKK